MNYKILINQENKITKSFLNNISFVQVKNYLDEDIYLERKTYQQFLKLKEFLKESGIEILLSSGKEDISAEERAVGLSLSYIVSKNEDLEKISVSLKDFGFITRYPKNKESITGHLYDPYYIRYVGCSTARIIYKERLTLEEYNQKYNVSGVVVVNKPSGMTSREVDEVIGKKFDTKKVGHTGTLDPLASGVLIVLLNQATKIQSDITSEDKEYIATARLGILTDTLDVTGNILKTKKVDRKIDFTSLLHSFEKTYMQEVPIYSAVKVGGKKLYEYARRGEDVELPKKMVSIKKLELLEVGDDTFTFKCLVSKGTYIRSLIRDMGESIGVLMSMEKLIRTREATFSLEDSYTLEEILNNQYKIVSIEDVFSYPSLEVDKDILFKIKNGAVIPNLYSIEDKVIFKSKNKVIAIYQRDGELLKSYRSFSC